MKNTGVCSKCGSTDIVKVTGSSRYYNVIPTGVMSMAGVDRWVCCSCGYAEEWIESKKLQKLREYWKEQE